MAQTAIYLRQSRDRTGDGVAVARQREDCLKLCDLKGWDAPRIFEDNDISASNGKTRPAFERLVHAIHAGEVTRLAVWHLDRLTRSTRDLQRVIDTGRPRALEISAVTGTSLNLADPSGVAVAEILTSVAQMEVRHKGARQARANEQRAEAGVSFWTVRPFGYDLRGGRVIVIEDEAEAIRAGVASILEGGSIAGVVRAWNKTHPTTRGNKWAVRSVTRVLRNPRYIGRRLHRGQDVAKGKWAPILDEETFEALQRRLDDPNRLPAHDRAVKHLLAGLLTCAECGEPCHGRGEKNPIYRCASGHVQRQRGPIDDLVRSLVLARLRPIAGKLTARDDDLRKLRAEATSIRDRRDTLASLLADGMMSPAAVREQSAKLTAELHKVEAEIQRAEDADALGALAASDDLAAAWDRTPLLAQRDIIRQLFESLVLQPAGKGIRFSPEQLKIEWKVYA